MKKVTLLTMITVAIFAIAISAPVLGDTIFVGSSNAGVRQLEENLGTSAYNGVGRDIEHLAISSDTERLYCAASSSRKIAILDARTLTNIKTIEMPGEIRAMKLENGALYVLVAGNPAKVVIVSDASQEIIDEIEVGIDPLDMAITSDGSKIFVAKGRESKIDVISKETGELLGSISCGGSPCSLVLTSGESKLYAADSSSSEVIVIDANTHTILKRVAVGEECVRVSPAGSDIYAIDNSLIANAVYVIDTASDTLTRTIRLDDVPYDAIPHPNGNYSIILSPAGNKIYKVDNESLEVIAERRMPNTLSALVIDETITTLSTFGVIYSGGKPVESNAGEDTGAEVPDAGAEVPDTGVEVPDTGVEITDVGTLSSDYIIQIIAPNGGEKWNGTKWIEWAILEKPAGAPPGICTLSYSSDGYAGTPRPIAGGIYDIDGWFQWDTTTIEDEPSANYVVLMHAQIPGGTWADDLSDGTFTIDNKGPDVKIEYPHEQDRSNTSTSVYVRATAEDLVSGVVDADSGSIGEQISVTITVAGSPPTEYYMTKQTTGYYAGKYTRMVSITGDGARNIITVTAADNLGNVGTDEVSAFVGWIGHIELPHSFEYEISNVMDSSGAAVCEMMLDLMGQDGSGQLIAPFPDQDEIFTAGQPNNADTGITDELDEAGVDYVLDYYDPWDPGYNFEEQTRDILFEEYLDEIAHWIAWDIHEADPNVYENYIPALVPKHGYTLKPYHWVIINGVAASHDPWDFHEEPSFDIYGMWITDPEQTYNIGKDTYIESSSLQGILEPAPDKFVSVMDPPPHPDSEARIVPPVVNDSTLALVEIAEYFNSSGSLDRHLVDRALMVDLDEAQPILHYSLDGDLLKLFKVEELEDSPSICWKDIINPMLLTDKDFRAAIDGAIAREFLYVTRLDNNEESILIPFDKFTQGKFLSYAAIIVDRELGCFKQATWVKAPTRYIQVSKEDAIGRVIDLYPEASSKTIEARLVWEPGDISPSPFYPYWEVSVGESKYYVVEQ